MPFFAGAAGLIWGVVLLAAASPPPARAAGAAGTPAPIAPFKCPNAGPNGGNAPQAMASTAGKTLVLCADVEPAEGTGIVATAAAVHEAGSTTAAKPIFSAEDDTNRLRVAPVPEGGFAFTLEALLPEGGTDYTWAPIAGFDVACGPDGCGVRDRRCALALPASGRRDMMGEVRQQARQGRLEPSVAQRLLDNLTVQALLGEDAAAWTIEHLDRLVGVPPESQKALAGARDLLARARDAGCEALVPPKEQAVVVMSQAERAARIKEQIAKRRAAGANATPTTAPPEPPVVDLQTVGWLIGGRWEGQGKMADGRSLHVEETYRWGPGRKSIRFQAKNAGARSGATGSTIEGILFFEPRPGKIILWNVKPGGGLSESAVTRADASSCEMVGPDGRVRLVLSRPDSQNRTVDQLQGGSWKTVATAVYERRTP